MLKLRTTHFEQIPLAALKKILEEQANKETNAPGEAMEKTNKIEMKALPTDGVHNQGARG